MKLSIVMFGLPERKLGLMMMDEDDRNVKHRMYLGSPKDPFVCPF